MSETKPKSFAVCFSGGLDSTTVALVMGRRYRGQVHLITIQHRYGHVLPGLARRHVDDLKRILGEDRVFHHYAQTSQEFKDVVLGSLHQDYQTFGSNFIVCLGCNLSMDAHLIAYSLEHRIPTTFFGFTPNGSNFAVMSLPETSMARRALYASFGLLYRIPLMEWHMEKPEERALLRAHEVWPGWNFRKIAMGVQPLCLLGVAMHHMDIFFDKHPQYDRDKVTAFLEAKAPLVRAMVARLLEARGIDLEARVAELRQLNEDEWDRYGPDAPPLNDLIERQETADLAGLPSMAAQEFPARVPRIGHPSLSRDGRPRAGAPAPEPSLTSTGEGSLV